MRKGLIFLALSLFVTSAEAAYNHTLAVVNPKIKRSKGIEESLSFLAIKDNKVYEWLGILAGNENLLENHKTKAEVSEDSNFISVAGGYDFSMALTKEGEIKIWERLNLAGINTIYRSYGENIENWEEILINVSELTKSLRDIIAIAANRNNYLALDKKGNIYYIYLFKGDGIYRGRLLEVRSFKIDSMGKLYTWRVAPTLMTKFKRLFRKGKGYEVVNRNDAVSLKFDKLPFTLPNIAKKGTGFLNIVAGSQTSFGIQSDRVIGWPNQLITDTWTSVDKKSAANWNNKVFIKDLPEGQVLDIANSQDNYLALLEQGIVFSWQGNSSNAVTLWPKQNNMNFNSAIAIAASNNHGLVLVKPSIIETTNIKIFDENNQVQQNLPQALNNIIFTAVAANGNYYAAQDNAGNVIIGYLKGNVISNVEVPEELKLNQSVPPNQSVTKNLEEIPK